MYTYTWTYTSTFTYTYNIHKQIHVHVHIHVNVQVHVHLYMKALGWLWGGSGGSEGSWRGCEEAVGVWGAPGGLRGLCGSSEGALQGRTLQSIFCQPGPAQSIFERDVRAQSIFFRQSILGGQLPHSPFVVHFWKGGRGAVHFPGPGRSWKTAHFTAQHVVSILYLGPIGHGQAWPGAQVLARPSPGPVQYA